MELGKAIRARKSVRRYSSAKPDWRKIIQAISAARWAPMAGNMCCLKFILIKDEEKIKELGKCCQQDFVSKAHYVVAVVSDDTKLTRSYNEEGRKFARQQAGAAIENFLLVLTEQELATCWVGWFDENAVKRILKVPDDLVVEALFPIGKPTKIGEDKTKKKPDLDNLIYFDKWGNKYMEGKERVSFKSV